ncbi:hypothetical protein BDZ94DRAFT_1248508 [Collybia nuda]|uniref:F-box domain-containing protein n=1 Tax=Collybia nuda TaxID=64659 RepID=A0A9P5YH97_9AGAR|nr:hypothetical protein BDZ94DRAFT_1248508 [Collybia nuda]
MLPDLPVEIWLHIASLLPRGHVHKLAGINWMLYSLAMDETYQEVQFVDDGKDMLKTLRQLEYPGISSRVKHLYIRPGFFPKMVKPVLGMEMLGRLRWKAKLPRLSLKPREDNILSIAQRVLANCSETEQLSIVLYDLHPPPAFDDFLKTMWYSLGPHIRRLTIDATLAKFPLILQHTLSGVLPNLTELHINLAVSRVFTTHKQELSAVGSIMYFANTLSDTLQSLTISSSEMNDINFLFTTFRSLPHLQKLAVPTLMSNSVHPRALTQFLTRHKATLRHFSFGSSEVAGPWAEPGIPYQEWAMQGFCELELPALKSLRIRILRHYWTNDVVTLPLSSARLPQLVSLTLLDTYMLCDELKTLFGSVFQGNRLESLQLRVKELGSEVLNTLAMTLPNLTDLDITFKYRSVWNALICDSEALRDLDFEKQMMNCHYPNWMIRNLRLSQVHQYSCAQSHPHLRTMNIVARCLPFPVRLHIENDCTCSDRPLLC